MKATLEIDIERLRQLRTSRAWPQEQLAEIAGIGPRTLQRIEATGKASLESVRALASAFDIPPDQLLKQAKTMDEKSIRALPKPFLLERLQTGNEILSVVLGALCYYHGHVDLNTMKEAELVGGLLQELQDWNDCLTDMDTARRVELSVVFTGRIEELSTAGFAIFGTQRRMNHRLGNDATGKSIIEAWPTSILRVLRDDDPEIIRLPDGHEILPTLFEAQFQTGSPPEPVEE